MKHSQTVQILFFFFILIHSAILHSSDSVQSDAHWEQTKLSSSFVSKIFFDPKDENKVYAATTGGLYLSSDGGRTWVSKILSFQTDGKIDTIPVKSIAIDPVFTHLIYIATVRGLFQSHDGIRFRKTNVAGSGLNVNSFNEIVAIPVAVGTDLPDGSMRPSDVFTVSGNNIFQSINAGKNWVKISSEEISVPALSMVSDPKNMRTVYLVSGTEIFSSKDSGNHWKKISPENGWNYKSFLIHPENSEILFAAAYRDISNSTSPVFQSKLFISTNTAKSWFSASVPQENSSVFNSLSIDAKKRIYIGTDQGVLTSDLNLSTWSWMNDGLPEDKAISVLCIEPSLSGHFLLMGTAGHGIFRIQISEQK